MKNFITTAVALLMTAICFGQTFTTSGNSANYCDQLEQEIVRLNQRIESMEKRETFINSKEVIDQKQLNVVLNRKQIAVNQRTKTALIQSENCNPTGNSTPKTAASKIKVKKISIKKADFENLSKERKDQIIANPELYEVID